MVLINFVSCFEAYNLHFINQRLKNQNQKKVFHRRPNSAIFAIGSNHGITAWLPAERLLHEAPVERNEPVSRYHALRRQADG